MTGRNYRLLVVGNKMVAASERMPCRVVGDGVRTIKELIDIENSNPLRGEGHEKPLTKIKVDQSVIQHLKRSGLTTRYVPATNEEVVLSERVNLSAGATARDVTDEVHPSIKAMCERAARLAGPDICGVDLITEDISQPVERGGILELNAGPGLRMHCFPTEGKPRDVGGAIVEMLYPKGENGAVAPGPAWRIDRLTGVDGILGQLRSTHKAEFLVVKRSLTDSAFGVSRAV